LVTIDTNNEVFFLKHVEKTPAILVYEKKGDNFWEVDPMLGQPLTPE